MLFRSVKTINTEKVYLPMKSKLLCLLPWSVFSCCRRILSMVTFFLPSLGLFSILYHWKAEQITFELRKYYASSNDTLELFGVTEKILWSAIDRGQYDDQGKYTPVHYSTYTGLSLGATFYAFIIITVVHFFIIFIIKIITAYDFKNDNLFNRVRICILSLSMSMF